MLNTNISCTDTPMHPRHSVRFLDDGTVECGCGPSAVEGGMRLGTAVAMGTPNILRRSCAGLIAFVKIGLPRLVALGADKTGAWGGWKDAWISYASNTVVREEMTRLVYERDVQHEETFAHARRALSKCARYRDGIHQHAFMREVAFLPNTEPVLGVPVAFFASDGWIIPLQEGWLENVGKAQPVIDGKFIVGIVPDKAGFVLAIDSNGNGGFCVEEFAVVRGKLGKIKR